jgi:CBS-domain-containing membrane protein
VKRHGRRVGLAEKISAEIVALMAAVKRNDLGSALQHQEKAIDFTRLALEAIRLEIESRELDCRSLGPLRSMQIMYRDVELCLTNQRAIIERLALVYARIQAKHSGVVGRA